jgi:hypothetical protein
MKTTINEQGCTTHPYGSPSLEVTVPVTIQGVNILEELLYLRGQIETLRTMKQQPAAVAPVATPEPLEAPAVTPEPPVEQSAVEEVSAPAKATTGKKSAKAAE